MRRVLRILDWGQIIEMLEGVDASSEVCHSDFNDHFHDMCEDSIQNIVQPSPPPFPLSGPHSSPSYLLHLTPIPLPLPLHPQNPKLPHLHPLPPHKHTPIHPALEVPLPGRDAAVVLPIGFVERDADPWRVGGAGE